MEMQDFTSVPTLVSCSTARLAVTREMFSLYPSEPNLSGPARFKFNPSKPEEFHKPALFQEKLLGQISIDAGKILSLKYIIS